MEYRGQYYVLEGEPRMCEREYDAIFSAIGGVGVSAAFVGVALLSRWGQ
ncbi:hypothetical protein [Haladaptatus halobius]|nr:hypothetical protein [Haladaptatus halobius]